MNDRPSSVVIIRIGVVALLIRYAFFLANASSPLFARPLLDQHYYHLCAKQLAGTAGNIIDGFRPLLYPLFLSFFYRLTSDGGIVASIIAQHLLGIGMVVLVGLLATRFFHDIKVGITSAVLFCLSGPPLYFEEQLLITTLFSFLLLLFWLSFHAASKASKPRTATTLWLRAGIVLGLAAQARPNALPLLILFPLVSIYRAIHRKKGCTPPRNECLKDDTHDVPMPAAGLPLLALAGVLGVQVLFGCLNAKYSGRFSLMTHAGGINFYLGNSQKADGMIPRQSRHVVYAGEYRDPIQVMAVQGYREATGDTESASQKKVSDYWNNRTIEEIKADPFRWSRLMLKKAWLILWTHEVPNNRSYSFAAQHETPLLRWLPVRWWLLLILLPWGITALLKQGERELLFWISGFFILFSGTIVIFFVNSRFRIPLWPGMAIMAGGGLQHIWNCIKVRKIPIRPALVSLVLLLASCINCFGIPPDPIENDLSMRANVFYEQGRYNEALQDIQQCLAISPNNPRYYFVLGNILLASDMNSKAITAYLHAIDLDSSDSTFHNNLGIAFENAGELDKAEIAYRKALALQPDYSAATVNLMLLSIQRRDLKTARSILTQIPKESFNNSTLCVSAVLEYMESGDVEALEKAKTINPPLTDQLIQHKVKPEAP